MYVTYGTHQLQLKHDMRVPCGVDHELHTQFCCTPVILCVVSSEPRRCEKTHELRVHLHTFPYARMHACIGYTHTHTQYNL